MKSRIFSRILFLSVFICEMSLCAIAQTLYEVKFLDFNTREFDEFAPVVYNDGLVINTYRKQYLYKTEVDLNENDINDLYYVKKLNSGEWGNLQFFSRDLNSRNHEGKATFSTDGNTIFFTRFGNDSTGNVFKATKSGGGWNNPVLISLNSEKYRIKDPCLSNDGKKLYFASRAPGGFGGYDIYVSSFERGDWSTPKNLGPLVNTKGDEIAPFMHTKGKLFFSSNHSHGLGGFDIFYTQEINEKWITPKQLPEPINSNRDDLYYFSDAVDSIGYFSSNRNRSFDIYSFKSLWPSFGECKALQKNEYTYIFSEKGNVDNDTTAWLYEWDFGDGTKIRDKKAEAEHTFAGPGQYIIQLNIIETLTGEILVNEDAYPFEVENVEQAYISCPDTLTEGVNTEFDASLTYLPELKKIDYYFWDFGEGERATGIAPDHIYHSGQYTVKLCVQSVPDQSGVIKKSCVSKEIIVLSSP